MPQPSVEVRRQCVGITSLLPSCGWVEVGPLGLETSVYFLSHFADRY